MQRGRWVRQMRWTLEATTGRPLALRVLQLLKTASSSRVRISKHITGALAAATP